MAWGDRPHGISGKEGCLEKPGPGEFLEIGVNFWKWPAQTGLQCEQSCGKRKLPTCLGDEAQTI